MATRDRPGSDSNTRPRMLVACLAALACFGCAAAPAAIPDAGDAAPTTAESHEIAMLERAFWYCDYVATTRGVLAAPIVACKHATDELKARKFGGSFQALLAWWQANKAVEHDRLERMNGKDWPPGSV